MGTSSVGSKTPLTSVDNERMSIVTGTPISALDEPGRGCIYDPSVFAAGALVHVHQAKNVFLLAHSRTWTAATPIPASPGEFSAKTVQPRATFRWVNTDSGERVPAVDRSGTPGLLYSSGPNWRLVSGASNGGMVYYLGIQDGTPLLVTYRTDAGAVEFISSEWLNPMGSVNWNKGIFVHGNHMYVVGSDATGVLYMHRRNLMGNAMRSYLGATGWVLSPGGMVSMKDAYGTPLKSLGPVSLFTTASTWFLSVTAKPAADTIASFYRSNHPLSGWVPMSPTVNLGANANAVSDGVFFQSALHANAKHALLAAADVVGGIPATWTGETSTRLATQWGLLAIPTYKL